MPTRNDQAIVLRLSDYSESSQIVSLFTTTAGLVRLIAKGARRGTRKRFAAGLDLLEHGDVSYIPPRGDAGLGTLTEWVQRDPFSGIRRDLLRQYGGLYAAELVSKLTEEHDPHPELFAALVGLLRDLAGDTGLPAGRVAALVRFQSALLRAIGFAPVLRRCVDCGRPRVRGTPGYFSSTAGGLVCRDCEMHHTEKRRVSPIMLDGPAGRQRPAEWFGLLDYHLMHVAGREPRTAAQLRLLVADAAG